MTDLEGFDRLPDVLDVTARRGSITPPPLSAPLRVSLIFDEELKPDGVLALQNVQRRVNELYHVRAIVVGGGYGCQRVTIDFLPDPNDPDAAPKVIAAVHEIMRIAIENGCVRYVLEDPHHGAKWKWPSKDGQEQIDQAQLRHAIQIWNVHINANDVKLESYAAGQAGNQGGDGSVDVTQIMNLQSSAVSKPSILSEQLGKLSLELKTLARSSRESDQAALASALQEIALDGNSDELTSRMGAVDSWALDVADQLRLEEILKIFRTTHPESHRFWREGRERGRRAEDLQA